MTTLDPRILSTSLPANMADIVEKTARNVDAQVELIISDFRKTLSTKVSTITNGVWDSDLREKLERVEKEATKSLDELEAQRKKVADAAERASSLAKTVTTDVGLLTAVEEMTNATSGLEEEIKKLRAQVRGMSTQVGSLVGNAAANAIGLR